MQTTVLAHELGHILLNHFQKTHRARYMQGLEADVFARLITERLGAGNAAVLAPRIKMNQQHCQQAVENIAEEVTAIFQQLDLSNTRP